MSLQGRAQKYASNRKQELELKKELEAIKHKALLERSAKQLGGQSSTPLPHPMSPPGKTQPQAVASRVTKPRRVRPISSKQQPIPSSVAVPDASIHTTANYDAEPTTQSLKRVKSPAKSTSIQKHNLHAKVGGAAGNSKKQAASQKVTMDTSQKVKFAIVNSQNTSMQMNLSQRQPERMPGKETSSLAVDGKLHGKPNLKSPRSRLGRQKSLHVDVPSSEGTQSRPFSRPTGTDSHLSASSYQHYIMSQTTDYRNNTRDTSSNLATKTANTPAPLIIEHGISVSVSGIDSSFQPSKIDFCESFHDDETSEGSEILSQSVSQLDEEETDTGSYSTRPDSSGSYSYSIMTGEQMDNPLLRGDPEMVSTKPQSGRVTIEVDMRFSSSIDRPVSELSQLSSNLTDGGGHGEGDGLSVSGAVSEQSRAASGSRSQEGELDSERDGGSVSKRSSVSNQSDMLVESQPRLDHSSVQSSQSASTLCEDLSAPKQESFDKTSALLEHLGEGAPAISTTGGTSISDRRFSDISTARLDVLQDRKSKSSTTLHDDSQSSIDRSPRPHSHSLSSIGMPPSYSPLPASQDGTATPSSISASSQHHEYQSLPPPLQSVTTASQTQSSLGPVLDQSSLQQYQSFTPPSQQSVATAATSQTQSQCSSLGSIQSSQQQYQSFTPPSQSVTTAATSQTQSQRSSLGSIQSSQQHYHSFTPPLSQSVTTASQRSSFGSVPSSMPSIKPSATHMMIEGLRHLSTSGSHADTSSWLLAHHSGSKIRSDFPASEEQDRDAIDLVEREDSYDTGSLKYAKSEIFEVDDSASLLGANLQHESQSQSRLQDFDSRESSNVSLTKTDDSARDEVDKTDQQETQIDTQEDKDGGVSVPAVQLQVDQPPEIKVIVCSESQESVPTEREYSMANLIETEMNLRGDTDDTADSGESREKHDSTPVNLAEYLAFSSDPVTLEDVMHISGQALPTTPRLPPKSPRKQESKLPRPPSSPREPKVRFLSTWESPSKIGLQSTSTQRRSIHHFCMEPSLPRLPIHLQVASRQAHAKPGQVAKQEKGDLEQEEGAVGGEICIDKIESTEESQEKIQSRDLSSANVNLHPPPNTPYTATRTTSVPTVRGRTAVIRQGDEAAAKEKTSKHSERPQTVGQSSCLTRSDESDIIERAKSQLSKELRGEMKPSSSAKLREKRVKKRATPLFEIDKENSKMVLGGSSMKVAKNPSNLLWVPAPPKLSLHPSTVQTHLFPDYHSSSTHHSGPAGGGGGQPWMQGPSWLLQGGVFASKAGEQGESSDGYQKKLLPLAFSSVKNMSLLQNLTVPSSSTQGSTPSRTPSASIKTDSLQPSTNGSQVHVSAELRTPLSPTSSTLSGHSGASDKQSTRDSSQGDSTTITQISDVARRAALARRRHTVFITHATKEKVSGATDGGDNVEGEQDLDEDEESGKFQGTERKAKKLKVDDSVRQTQSMPLIVDDSTTASSAAVEGDGSGRHQGTPSGVSKSVEYKRVMEEVKGQREQLLAFHSRQREEEEEEFLKEEMEGAKGEGGEEDGSAVEELQPMEGSMLATSGAFVSRKLQRQAMRAGRRVGGGTGGGARNTTGRVRALRRTRSAQIRVQQARETLSQPPNILTRSTSFPLLKDELVHNTIQQSSNDYRQSRRKSVPSLLTSAHFQSLQRHIEATDPLTLKTQSGEGDSPYEWALSLWWDRWFPEVLEEYKQIVAAYSTSKTSYTLNYYGLQPGTSRSYRTLLPKKTKKDHKPEEKEKCEVDAGPPELVRLANIDPPPSLSSKELQQIETEITKLTTTMSSCRDDGMRAVYLCRRGAMLRKVGRLQDSLSDLRTSLSLQPSLSDSLWHRHLLYLIQGDEKLALDDLNVLLKTNKKHFGGYRSRASLVLGQGDTSKAVFNLSKAIALQSNDPEMYFMRAELYERRGEVESALTDYARVNELQPSNVVAITRQAMHKFNKRMWAASTQHFNALLQLDPNNTQARIHRARAQYKLGRYVEALQDVSAAIHLDPNGAPAFYHRACLLQTSQPEQALRDLSVSLLLDDSVANVSAYVHRGVLYTQMKCYNEALCDFESAMKLQRSLPSPHVLAGLIHMLHKGNLPRAARCFTTAISVDPTCTRAYLCRAEAYRRGEMYDRAILDCTRVIHLEPNNPTYYLRKGELYLSLKNYPMAALHIRTAAKLCHSGFNQSKTQQALVESFLGHHAEAVDLLKTLLRSPAVFSLMGRIQFKAKRYEDAVGSFRQAIALVERSLQPTYMVAQLSELDMTSSAVTRKVRGDIHYQCGRSLVEGGAMEDAIEEFSELIKHCPSNAMGYYERGVAKLKAGHSKGIHDLNKSLAVDPGLFQAFLARAVHYSQTGRYSKAILNCNEAIRIVPNSVRAYVYRGALKYHLKLYSGAVDDLNTAISLDPAHSAIAFFNRALCHQAMGELHKALADYSTVLLLHDSPSTEYSYKVFINRGLLYLQLKDFANALLDFMEAEKCPSSDNERGNPAIHQAIGYCHHQLGSLDAAISAYSLAIAEDPSFFEAYVGRGNVHMDFLNEQGFTNSKADYLHVLELDGSYLPARVNLAFLLQAEGRFKLAWDELSCVLKEDSSFAPALEARGVISLQMGNTFGALLDISNAIKVKESAALLTNRGVVHQFIGDLINAMRDYQKAVSIQSDYSLAHFNIGNVLFQQRHFKQAITSYTRALSSHQDDSVLVNRGIVHSILRDTKLALADFDLAIELNPHSAPSYFNRGNLHYSLGDYSSAEQDYKKALELQPDDWLTMYYCGEVLGRQGKMEDSRDMFKLAAQTEITIH